MIIPASILAFFKLKKKKSQNSSAIEMQNNDPERALQVLPQIDQHPSSQDLSQNVIDQTGESDEETTYMDRDSTYSKLHDVALIQEKQDEENQYANNPVREDFE